MRVCVSFLVSAMLTVLQLARGSAPATSLFTLPELAFDQLISGNPTTARTLVDHLTTLGIVQITGIPRFGLSRRRALGDLAECLSEEQSAPAIVMADGAKRVSTGAATHRGVSGKMDNVCGETADKLRASVDSTMELVFSLLDGQMRQPLDAPLMQPKYGSFNQLMSEGEHLEHLHTYFAADESSAQSASSTATLDFHVDAGMMIAMTTGLYSGAEPSAASGLYVKLPNGDNVRASMRDDALVLLMGAGAEQWLSPVFGKPLHAPSHALVADLAAGGSRSWYGKMYLPPADAKLAGSEQSFAEFHQLASNNAGTLNEVRRDSDQSSLQRLLPAACGGELQSRYLLTVASTCNADQVWCWARCMDASTLTCADPVCYDYSLDKVISGDNMCMSGSTVTCGPACLNTTTDNSTSYCIGGTSMYMTGFTAMASGESDMECVNLLWPEWTLDTAGKYAGACIGVFLMCILIQFITKARSSLKIDNIIVKRFVNTLLFGVQITFSYFAMLVAMTYSVAV